MKAIDVKGIIIGSYLFHVILNFDYLQTAPTNYVCICVFLINTMLIATKESVDIIILIVQK